MQDGFCLSISTPSVLLDGTLLEIPMEGARLAAASSRMSYGCFCFDFWRCHVLKLER